MTGVKIFFLSSYFKKGGSTFKDYQMSSTRAWLITAQAALAALVVGMAILFVRAVRSKDTNGKPVPVGIWPKIALGVSIAALVAYVLYIVLTPEWKDELALLASDNKNIFEVKKDGVADTSVVSTEVAKLAASNINTFQRPYQIELLKGPATGLVADNAFLVALQEAQKEKKQDGAVRFKVTVPTLP